MSTRFFKYAVIGSFPQLQSWHRRRSNRLQTSRPEIRLQLGLLLTDQEELMMIHRYSHGKVPGEQQGPSC
jgi:hypothetical protein